MRQCSYALWRKKIDMKADSKLQSDVLHELNWWPSVNAQQIRVTTHNGVITLTGQVTHYTQKMSAEEIAKRVYGVVALANDIEIESRSGVKHYQKEPAAGGVRYLLEVIAVTNLITLKPNVMWIDVKGKMENAFKRMAKANPQHITVNTHDDGTAVLTGTVASWSERDMAVVASWASPGVSAVVDNLVVAH